MANKVVKIVAAWQDGAGLQTRSIFLVRRRLDVDGSLLKSDTATDVKAIVDKMEAISKLKFVSASLQLLVDSSGWNVKADPIAGASVNKEAFVEFIGELGDSLKATKTRVWIPSPKDSILAGNNTRVDYQHSDVQGFLSAVTTNVLTMGGTNLAGVGASNVRIRRTRK